jgi:hypothetical protein
MMPPLRPSLVAFIGATLVAAATGTHPCQADVHTVTDLGDTTPGGAPGQLRRLIANATAGDTIMIPAGVITLAGPPGDDANGGGDLDIATSLTIQGSGPGVTIVDGGGIDRVFSVLSPSAAVTLSGLTIRNGRAVGASGGGIRLVSGNLTLVNVIVAGNHADLDGGGLSLAGTATLTDVVVLDNVADRDGGGIISNSGSVATLTRVTIDGNRAARAAGGLLTRGTLTLIACTISGNSSLKGAGAIRSEAPLTLTACTISGNAGDFGGGIENLASLTLTNVTISGNAASTSGGGLGNFGTAVAALTNVTINGNAATFGGGLNNSATATLRNTIIANSPAGDNCAGPLTSLGSNLSQDDSCQASLTATGDVNARSPLLGPLQNYGGATRTHALLPGSPAINGGTGMGCPATDQRGFARPQGPACDIGAFEFGVLAAAVEIEGSAFATGQMVAYHGAVSPGLAPIMVDVYLGALLPGFATFLSLVDHGGGQIGVVVGPAPVPFQSNVPAEPLTVSFQYTFGGAEPAGTYFAYAGLTVAGGNPLAPVNQLSLDIQPFLFSP